jgi:hypothetical protein
MGGALDSDTFDAPPVQNNPIGTAFWPARLLGVATPYFVYRDMSDFLKDSPPGLPTGQKYTKAEPLLPVASVTTGDATKYKPMQLSVRSMNPLDHRLALIQAADQEEYEAYIKTLEAGALTTEARSDLLKTGGMPLHTFLEGIEDTPDIFVVNDFGDLTGAKWISNSYWYPERYTFDDAELIVYSASPYDIRCVALPMAYKDKLAKIAVTRKAYLQNYLKQERDAANLRAKQNQDAIDAAAAAYAAAHPPEKMSAWQGFKAGFVGAVKLGVQVIPKIL